jgi:hypothetical protein
MAFPLRLLLGLHAGGYCAQSDVFLSLSFPSLSFLIMLSSLISDRISRLSALNGSFYTISPERYIGKCNLWESYSPLEEEDLSFSLLEASAGRHLAYPKLSPEDTFKAFSEKKLHSKAALVFCPAYCQGGDYSGASLVELSNCDVLLEDYGGKGVWRLYGGHGSFGLAIDVRFCSEELLQELEALESYPLASEDKLSELEIEKEAEAWHCWASADFTKELSTLLSSFCSEASEQKLEALEDKLESLEEDKLFELFREACDLGSHYWETEGLDRWINVEKVAASVSFSSLLEALS